MQYVLYTLTGIVLYLAADWLLQRLEDTAGRRFEYRSLIFFALLSALALTSFALIRHLAP